MRISLPIIVSAALLASACGNQTASHPHTSSALQALQTFAGDYGAYLDGRVPAATLPDASASARGQVGPPIPAARRAGTLALVAVSQIARSRSYIVTLRDAQHTFGAQLTLTATATGWVVSAVSPPDLDTIFGPSARAIPPPAGSAEAQQAARAFISGYLAWLYGHGPVDAIPHAAPPLLTQLKANPPPNAPPAFLRAHLVTLELTADPDEWLAYVSVNDGQLTYHLPLTVIATQGRWLVTKVGSPQ
ncbi:MAG: hypothetical protein ACLP50_30905 [Solirubrobacteraceae bacterium]